VKHRSRTVFVAALAALTLSTVAPITHANAIKVAPPCTATDWPMFGHDLGRSFASPDTCITKLNAPTLRPAWFFDTGSPVTAQPAVVDGVLYVGAFDGKFYALHAATGKPAWPAPFDVTLYDNEQTDYGAIPGSAAVATIGNELVGRRKVVVFGGGDTLFVVNAGTGALLARQCLDRVDPTCQGGAGTTSEAEASPVLVPRLDGGVEILVGTDVNEADPSGPAGLFALALAPDATLTPDWQFDPETGVTTDADHGGMPPLDPGKSEHGCNGVWSSPSVDLATRTVAFGIGNCNHPEKVAPSAMLPVESTIGLDLDTGALKWQAAPNLVDNGLDLDFGATPNVMGDAVGEGGKDGSYYVYDVATGALRWKVKVATGSSIGGMIASTAVGTLSNGHKAVFASSAIPVSPNDPKGSIRNDVDHPNQAFGVHAVDATTHTVLWDSPAGPAFGAPVFANGVVFVPDTTNDSLLVFHAETGVVLRAQPLNAPPSSPVAVVGRSVYMGSGTTQSSPPLSAIGALGGIWSFTV
jgi:outer membrane protein assembly factor BamB